MALYSEVKDICFKNSETEIQVCISNKVLGFIRLYVVMPGNNQWNNPWLCKVVSMSESKSVLFTAYYILSRL